MGGEQTVRHVERARENEPRIGNFFAAGALQER